MQTRVTITNGNAKFDVLDGQGDECRQRLGGLYARLAQKLGLKPYAIREESKPAMLCADEATNVDPVTH